jgi:NHL repeat-containing protein
MRMTSEVIVITLAVISFLTLFTYILTTTFSGVNAEKQEYSLIKKWPKSLCPRANSPIYIVVDSKDKVYTLSEGGCIEKFSNNGTLITKFNLFNSSSSDILYNYGFFAVDSRGNFYISGSSLEGTFPSDAVEKFSSNGTFIKNIGNEGKGFCKLLSPSGIAIDHSDNLYIADNPILGGFENYSRIQKCTSDGKFIAGWNNFHTLEFGELKRVFLRTPIGIAIDPSNNIFVTNVPSTVFGDEPVYKIPNNGTVMNWHNGTMMNWRLAQNFTNGNGIVHVPGSITTDSAGNVFVVDTASPSCFFSSTFSPYLPTRSSGFCSGETVQEFSSGGSFITTITNPQNGKNRQVQFPVGVAVDSSHNVYIADAGTNQIFVYAHTR